MIRSLHLKNFRSYRDYKFIFCKGINLIVGDGLSGKTNIVRALQRLCYYRPLRSKHRSYFANEEDETSIDVLFDDCEVLLSQTKKDSVYKLVVNGDKQEFRKFGADCPRKYREFSFAIPR